MPIGVDAAADLAYGLQLLALFAVVLALSWLAGK
jgi:hypothetical protein